MTQNKIEFFLFFLIFLLLIFSIANAIFIGASWDEYWEHVNGLLRLKFLLSLGEFKDYDFQVSSKFHPGLYSTIVSAIIYFFSLFSPKFVDNYFFEIRHVIYFIFGSLSIFGFYKFIKIFFNKEIALLSSAITLINPFFFSHMIMNPKDIIIFFSLIWFIYFFYKYTVTKDNLLNLFLFSFFVGFGSGVRFTFIGITLPIFLFTLIYFIKTNSFNTLKKIRAKILHLIIFFFIVFFVAISCWPHVIEGGFDLLIETIIKSFSWFDIPKFGLINGVFYETANTPRTYFLDFIFYRMPLFHTFLLISSIVIVLLNLKSLNKIFCKNFFIKFLCLVIFIMFPILITIIFKATLYDNIRLFLFLIPFLSVLSSFVLVHILFNKDNKMILNIISVVFVFLLIIFIFRFITLTPYHYSYVNYSYINLSSTNYKFENDYWGTSFKEIVKKIKSNFKDEDITKMKIAVCGGNSQALLYYLNKDLGIKKIYSRSVATHIIMTNRTSFDVNDKRTCFQKYIGKDLLFVSRGGAIMSTFRKIN